MESIDFGLHVSFLKLGTLSFLVATYHLKAIL